MAKKKPVFKTLFTSTFYLSAFTFGGGYVMVPLMEEKFVHNLNWIAEDEMLDLIAIAQTAPGPIAVNTSIIIGYRIAGFKGAIVTALGTAVPPLIIMSIVAFIYQTIRDNVFVNNLLLGMQAAVAAIILNVVYNMVSRIVKKKKMTPIAVMVFSLVAGILLKINLLFILTFAALVGAINTYWEIFQESKKDKKEGKS